MSDSVSQHVHKAERRVGSRRDGEVRSAAGSAAGGCAESPLAVPTHRNRDARRRVVEWVAVWVVVPSEVAPDDAKEPLVVRAVVGGELELRELVWREIVGQRRRGILARRPEAVGGGGAVGEAVPPAVQLGALGGDRGEDGALRL